MSTSKQPVRQVTLLPQQRTFTVRAGETILDAALHAGLNLPHSCKGGSCGACRARIVSGSVVYPDGPPLGLSAEEQAQSYALLCEAHAQTDLSLDVREIRMADEVQIRELPCRIARKQLLAPDVMAIFLQLPVVEPFHFVPGQYLDILLADGRRRSFSIASPPHDSRPLELHVRCAPGGEFSQRVFGDLEEKALLRIEGPLGQFCYRSVDRPVDHGPSGGAAGVSSTETKEGPALLIGGGTGFAPLKSMIRHVLEKGLRDRLHLYWGARTVADLYEDALVRQWAAAHGNFTYTPVLSAASADEKWPGRTGLVHAAAFADYPDLGAMEVYASGPPAMIDAIKREGAAHGLRSECLHFDSFEYAPDALQKMRRRGA